jgi:hypothetical protein
MNWEKVNEFVAGWAEQQGVPQDFKGKTLTLVDFESEEDCAFFYPGRTLLAQKAFTSALSKFARARHARTEHITINRDHYQHWLLAEKQEDSEQNRGRFIESRYKILP